MFSEGLKSLWSEQPGRSGSPARHKEISLINKNVVSSERQGCSDFSLLSQAPVISLNSVGWGLMWKGLFYQKLLNIGPWVILLWCPSINELLTGQGDLPPKLLWCHAWGLAPGHQRRCPWSHSSTSGVYGAWLDSGGVQWAWAYIGGPPEVTEGGFIRNQGTRETGDSTFALSR